MTKLRSNNDGFPFTARTDYRQHLQQLVASALPADFELAAANFARSTASSYWLIKKSNAKHSHDWITLRVATHPLWLAHAQQIEILWQHPGDFTELASTIKQALNPVAISDNQFQLSQLDIALLRLLTALERHKLIWFIRMAPAMAASHKAVSFDLKTDFLAAQLYLGDRNNANNLLVPVAVPDFQQRLATFYGRNLLFSQFTKHSLMKLLPTNQWLQPILGELEAPTDWQRLLVAAFGEGFIKVCLKLMDQENDHD
ncbi:hypothetical protein KOM07_08550 [Lentilactobacillus sp. G22-6]|uniref:hypothetical protein n=1 Tax=Lentilactobacillus dabitei TaxID=2831523 RepID=UPI001C25ECA8|nr:hypothetical protein [Lentilactobacillus dabitei]MBU9789582.1 hypothetical protein [Lentilactobacillus dabitei]